MNKKQWITLAIFSYILFVLLLTLDISPNFLKDDLCTSGEISRYDAEKKIYSRFDEGEITQEEFYDMYNYLNGGEVTQERTLALIYEVDCSKKGKIYLAFIWLFYVLGSIFMILAFLKFRKNG